MAGLYRRHHDVVCGPPLSGRIYNPRWPADCSQLIQGTYILNSPRRTPSRLLSLLVHHNRTPHNPITIYAPSNQHQLDSK